MMAAGKLLLMQGLLRNMPTSMGKGNMSATMRDVARYCAVPICLAYIPKPFPYGSDIVELSLLI
jgi:hypothetical protein